MATLTVRGLEDNQKKQLKKLAGKNSRSVNYVVLKAIAYYLANQISAEKELSDIEKAMK